MGNQLRSRVLQMWLRRKWFSIATALEYSPLCFHCNTYALGELTDEVSVIFRKESILTEDILGWNHHDIYKVDSEIEPPSTQLWFKYELSPQDCAWVPDGFTILWWKSVNGPLKLILDISFLPWSLVHCDMRGPCYHELSCLQCQASEFGWTHKPK